MGSEPVCSLRAQKLRLPLKSRKYHTDMHADIARLLVVCVYGFYYSYYYYYYYVFNLNNHIAVSIDDTKVKLHAYIARLLRVNYIKQ